MDINFWLQVVKKANFICPKCGNLIKDKVINNVVRFGLSCDKCSDGMSFGEKFIREFLVQLGCNFIYDKTVKWSNGKRYDFQIPSMSLIIEVHGIQHYEESFIRYSSNRNIRTLEEEIQNDFYKKDLALKNGIKYYIQLDCKESDCDYIKKSIMNSELINLFDLSTIDWDKCLQSTFKSNVILCANLWNNGMKSTKEIAKFIGMDISSVIPYLKKASKIGLCDYELNYSQNKIANKNLETICSLWDNGVRNISDLMRLSGLSNGTVYKMLKRANLQTHSKYRKQRELNKNFLCVETNKIYRTYSELRNDGFNPNAVVNCCRGDSKTSSGLHWEFILE